MAQYVEGTADERSKHCAALKRPRHPILCCPAAGNELYELWEGVKRGTSEYAALKVGDGREAVHSNFARSMREDHACLWHKAGHCSPLADLHCTAFLSLPQEELSQCLWAALEKIIPDVRIRAELALVGTPLTHERFLRRYKGTYGKQRLGLGNISA